MDEYDYLNSASYYPFDKLVPLPAPPMSSFSNGIGRFYGVLYKIFRYNISFPPCSEEAIHILLVKAPIRILTQYPLNYLPEHEFPSFLYLLIKGAIFRISNNHFDVLQLLDVMMELSKSSKNLTITQILIDKHLPYKKNNAIVDKDNTDSTIAFLFVKTKLINAILSVVFKNGNFSEYPILIKILQFSQPFLNIDRSDAFAADAFSYYNKDFQIDVPSEDQMTNILILLRLMLISSYDDNTKTKITDRYFEVIYYCLHSKMKGIAKTELETILNNYSEKSNYFIEKIQKIFNFILESCDDDDDKVLSSIVKFLHSKDKLIEQKNIYECIKGHFQLYNALFKYITSEFPKSIMDDLVANYTEFDLTMAEFVIALIKTNNYQSLHPEIVFQKLIELNSKSLRKDLNSFSQDRLYSISIFKAIENIFRNSNKNPNIFHICILLNNCLAILDNEDIMNSDVFDKVSESALENLDSLDVLIAFNFFPFLKIRDIAVFFNLAPHNDILFSILTHKCIDQMDEIVQEITKLNNKSITFENLLLSSYHNNHNVLFLFKLLSISQDPIYLDLIQKEIDENPQSIKKGILKQLALNCSNTFKECLLKIKLDSMKFEREDYSKDLNDDSIAFLSEIGYEANKDEINRLFNYSMSFYSRIIMTKEISLFNHSQIFNAYSFGCEIQNYELCNKLFSSLTLNNNSELQQLNYKDFLDINVFHTTSDIAALSLQLLSKQFFLHENSIDFVLNSLAHSSTQNDFNYIFSFLLDYFDWNEQLIENIFSIYFDNEFPPYYRNDSNTKALFKYVAKYPSFFYRYIENAKYKPFSEFLPATEPLYLQVFSNLPSLNKYIVDDSIKNILLRINYTNVPKINESSKMNAQTIYDAFSSCLKSIKPFEILSYSNGEIKSTTDICINPKISIADSIKKHYEMSLIINSPDVLIVSLNFSNDYQENLVIDEKIDLSLYCLEPSYYILRSIGTQNDDAVYLKTDQKYLRCDINKVQAVKTLKPSFTICNKPSYVVYEKVKEFAYDRQNGNQIIYNSSLMHQCWDTKKGALQNDKDLTVLKALNSMSINWKLFEFNNDFLKISIKLISELNIGSIICMFEDNKEFSNFFLSNMTVFDNSKIMKKYHNSIIKLFDLCDDQGIFIINWEEGITMKNCNNIFNILADCNTFYDNLFDFFTAVISKPDFLNFIKTQGFLKFFLHLIQHNNCNFNEIIDIMQQNKALFECLLSTMTLDFDQFVLNRISLLIQSLPPFPLNTILTAFSSFTKFTEEKSLVIMDIINNSFKDNNLSQSMLEAISNIQKSIWKSFSHKELFYQKFSQIFSLINDDSSYFFKPVLELSKGNPVTYQNFVKFIFENPVNCNNTTYLQSLLESLNTHLANIFYSKDNVFDENTPTIIAQTIDMINQVMIYQMPNIKFSDKVKDIYHINIQKMPHRIIPSLLRLYYNIGCINTDYFKELIKFIRNNLKNKTLDFNVLVSDEGKKSFSDLICMTYNKYIQNNYNDISLNHNLILKPLDILLDGHDKLLLTKDFNYGMVENFIKILLSFLKSKDDQYSQYKERIASKPNLTYLIYTKLTNTDANSTTSIKLFFYNYFKLVKMDDKNEKNVIYTIIHDYINQISGLEPDLKEHTILLIFILKKLPKDMKCEILNNSIPHINDIMEQHPYNQYLQEMLTNFIKEASDVSS